MNYDNITKENFNKYLEKIEGTLFQINMFLFENENEDNLDITFNVDYEDTDPEIIELYELKRIGLNFKDSINIMFEPLNIQFKKLFKFSHDNNIFFKHCSFKVYENTFENRFKDFEKKFIDVQKIEFVKKEVETILNSALLRLNLFSIENQTILKNAKIKKIEFLQSISKDFNLNIIKRDESDFFNFSKYKVDVKTETTENTNLKHENIFCNNGFILFEYILKEYVRNERGRLSDIHFFFRKMYESQPQFIHQRSETFKEWFYNNYNEDLGQIKTLLNVSNSNRNKHYSNALNWFKLQNQ